MDIDCMPKEEESPQSNKNHDTMLKKKNINLEKLDLPKNLNQNYANKRKIQRQSVFHLKQEDFSLLDSLKCENQEIKEEHCEDLEPVNNPQGKSKEDSLNSENQKIKEEHCEVLEQVNNPQGKSKEDFIDSIETIGDSIEVTYKNLSIDKICYPRNSFWNYFFTDTLDLKNNLKTKVLLENELRTPTSSYTRQEKNTMNRFAQRRYYKRHREKVLEYKKELYRDNRERLNQRQKEYHIKNLENEKKRQKEYWRKNKDKINARRKEFKRQNKKESMAKDEDQWSQFDKYLEVLK